MCITARKIEEIESESLRECKQDEGIVKSRFVLLNMVEPQFNGVPKDWDMGSI